MERTNETRRYCFLYFNIAHHSTGEIIKIGVSNNPEKRILEFNNGIKFRHKKGYCELVKFYRAFTIRYKNRKSAYKTELKFKRLNNEYCLNEFGSEVFHLKLEEAIGRLP